MTVKCSELSRNVSGSCFMPFFITGMTLLESETKLLQVGLNISEFRPGNAYLMYVNLLDLASASRNAECSTVV